MVETNAFPTTYESVTTAALMQAFQRGPDQVEASLEGLDDGDLRAPVVKGKWTIQEIVLHVADSEIMGAARFRQALAQSDRDFAFYAQDVWATELGYGEAGRDDMTAALAMFRALRRTTARLLDAASDDDWAKTGNHPEVGVITVRQLLELYADHSERHVAQILERRRRLGKPVGLPLLLAERLY